MKAAYPLTPKSGARTEPARLHWIELINRRRGFLIDGVKYNAARAADFIKADEAKTIFFFPNLREQVGPLIPHLLRYGKLSGAGDELRSLHFIQGTKTIFLSDASLYFHNPTREALSLLNRALFEELRVRLAPTPGNSAMRIMRRFIGINAMWQPGDLLRALSQASLSGGALHWRNGAYPRAYKYDMHGAYAWAMREAEYPLRPRIWPGFPGASGDGFMLVALCDFASNGHFSPLVLYGEDDEAYHPTLALDFKMAANLLDLQTLSAHGTLDIKKILCSITWQAGPHVLAEPMQKIDELQDKYVELKEALKVIRNACYGKIAESDEMTTLTLEPLSKDLRRGRQIMDIIEGPELLYALISDRKYKPAPQHNPLFAGLITAKIRQRLYDRIDEDTVYADTDGFISTRPRQDVPIGDGLGEWYLDETGRAVILGPRIYGMAGKTRIAGQHERVEMKELYRGLGQEIKVYEAIAPNPLTLEKIRTSERTLRAIKYPIVEALGDMLYVTRSPTVKIKSKIPDYL